MFEIHLKASKKPNLLNMFKTSLKLNSLQEIHKKYADKVYEGYLLFDTNSISSKNRKPEMLDEGRVGLRNVSPLENLI
jgi:hypothetical protein